MWSSFVPLLQVKLQVPCVHCYELRHFLWSILLHVPVELSVGQMRQLFSLVFVATQFAQTWLSNNEHEPRQTCATGGMGAPNDARRAFVDRVLPNELDTGKELLFDLIEPHDKGLVHVGSLVSTDGWIARLFRILAEMHLEAALVAQQVEINVDLACCGDGEKPHRRARGPGRQIGRIVVGSLQYALHLLDTRGLEMAFEEGVKHRFRARKDPRLRRRLQSSQTTSGRRTKKTRAHSDRRSAQSAGSRQAQPLVVVRIQSRSQRIYLHVYRPSSTGALF